MTVGYFRDLAEANARTFIKSLFRWRGSLWKSIHYELAAYMTLYSLIGALINGLAVTLEAEHYVNVVLTYCNEIRPILFTAVAFSMGFYVVQIYNRWWSLFMGIPWPDQLTFEMCAFFRDRSGTQKKDDEYIRQTIARYLCLSYVLVFRDISERVRQRFPELETLVGSLLTANELKSLRKEEQIKERRFWIPIEWVCLLLKKAYENGQIDDMHYSRMITTVLEYREKLHIVMLYDTVNLPLLYTQVVHFATYGYFLTRLIGSQQLVHPGMYWFQWIPFPFFTLFEFTVLIGWLKFGEVMLNPFGMDDDDFDMDILIERNFLVATCALANLFDKAPEMSDLDFKMVLPTESAESLDEESARPKKTLQGSAVGLQIPDTDQDRVAIFFDHSKKTTVMMKEKPSNKSVRLPVRTAEPILTPDHGKLFPKNPVDPASNGPPHAAAAPSSARKQTRTNTVKERMSRRQEASNDTSKYKQGKLKTPHPSKMDQPSTSKNVKSKASSVLGTSMLRKVERKRERMVLSREVDDTQRDDGQDSDQPVDRSMGSKVPYSPPCSADMDSIKTDKTQTPPHSNKKSASMQGTHKGSLRSSLRRNAKDSRHKRNNIE